MNRTLARLALASTLLSTSTFGRADSWPKMTGGSSVQCSQALTLATIAFQSSSHLQSSPEVPPAFGATLVAGRPGSDLPGGDGIFANTSAFDQIPIGGDGAPRSVYWQRVAQRGHRLAIRESARGWRGDTYAAYAVSESVTPAEFLAGTGEQIANPRIVPTISDSWTPPLVFRDKSTEEVWFIDVGQPYEFLADWRIYSISSTGARSECTLEFRPRVKKATELLPPSVRQLARLLDQTMGSGKNDGTLQSTAGLRNAASQTWANAALRPWTVGIPYNTRSEVDAGLRSWSQISPSHLRVYQAIQRQYPLATRSLAKYYETRFKRTAAQASASATFVMDVAFRAHYTFHSDDPRHSDHEYKHPPNPWISTSALEVPTPKNR